MKLECIICKCCWMVTILFRPQCEWSGINLVTGHYFKTWRQIWLFFKISFIKWVSRKWKINIEFYFNKLRPRQNGCHFTDDIFKCIFLNENVWISIKISLSFVPKGSINNISALVQIMAWCRPGENSSSEPIIFSLPMHICVTRPQWVSTIS